MGSKGVGSDYHNCPEDALRLPYDTRFEIPKAKFKIGNLA